MADSYLQTLGRIFHPTAVKVAATVVALVGIYDTFSNQFDLPKLGRVLGMSGSLLPWWGWLLILQSVFVIALFEYVRRNVEPKAQAVAADTEGEFVTPGYVTSVLEAQENSFKGTLGAVLNNIDVFSKRIGEVERRTAFPPNMGDTLEQAILSEQEVRQSNIARIRDEVEKAKQLLNNSHHETLYLLDYCVSAATRSVCYNLLGDRPRWKKIEPPTDATEREAALSDMRAWLNQVRQITTIAAYGAEIDTALQGSQQQAVGLVREIPPSQRPQVIDQFDFRDFFVAAHQCDFVAECLSSVIRQLSSAERERLQRLREYFTARSRH